MRAQSVDEVLLSRCPGPLNLKNSFSEVTMLTKPRPQRIHLPKGRQDAFRRSGVTDVSSHNLRKTFATRLLSRGAAITDVQHLLGHASVKTTEKAYAAFVKNERFKQTIDLLVKPTQPRLKVVN